MKMPLTRPATESTDWVPPLENGDRLTRDEFERRYEAMPEHIKAELIDGEVYLPSPARIEHHAGPHAHMIAWLNTFEESTRHVRAANNGTFRLDRNNEPQPDGSLILVHQSGQVVIDSDGYNLGAPEWIGEIASSSVSIELGAKKQAYERNHVQEYVVWRVLDREIDWFVLQAGKFERLAASPDGFLKSRVFPGLWLDAAAMIAGDMARVFQVLQQGLASPEHQDFVARLEA